MAPKRTRKGSAEDLANGAAVAAAALGEGEGQVSEGPAQGKKRARHGHASPEPAATAEEVDVLELRNRDVIQDEHATTEQPQSAAPQKRRKGGAAAAAAAAQAAAAQEMQAAEAEFAHQEDVVESLDEGMAGFGALDPNMLLQYNDQGFLETYPEGYENWAVDGYDPAQFAETYQEAGAPANNAAANTTTEAGAAAPAKRRHRGRPQGPGRDYTSDFCKKFKIEDRVYLVPVQHWYRVIDFFHNLEAEGVATVSNFARDFRHAAGEVGAKRNKTIEPGEVMVQEMFRDAAGDPASREASVDPAAAAANNGSRAETPVPTGTGAPPDVVPAAGGSGSGSAAVPGEKPKLPTTTTAMTHMLIADMLKPRVAKDRDFWIPERIEALRQGVILFAPYVNKDQLTITHYFHTGIFADRRTPALKDKRRNILSKLLRERRSDVVLEDLLPWIPGSLVNPPEKPLWENFILNNPLWREQAAEKIWPIRMTLMAELGLSEEDLIPPSVKPIKDVWWAEWIARQGEGYVVGEEGQGHEGYAEEHGHHEQHEHEQGQEGEQQYYDESGAVVGGGGGGEHEQGEEEQHVEEGVQHDGGEGEQVATA